MQSKRINDLIERIETVLDTNLETTLANTPHLETPYTIGQLIHIQRLIRGKETVLNLKAMKDQANEELVESLQKELQEITDLVGTVYPKLVLSLQQGMAIDLPKLTLSSDFTASEVREDIEDRYYDEYGTIKTYISEEQELDYRKVGTGIGLQDGGLIGGVAQLGELQLKSEHDYKGDTIKNEIEVGVYYIKTEEGNFNIVSSITSANLWRIGDKEEDYIRTNLLGEQPSMHLSDTPHIVDNITMYAITKGEKEIKLGLEELGSSYGEDFIGNIFEKDKKTIEKTLLKLLIDLG